MPEPNWREELKKAAPGAPVDLLTLERVAVYKKSGRILVRFQTADVLRREQ